SWRQAAGVLGLTLVASGFTGMTVNRVIASPQEHRTVNSSSQGTQLAQFGIPDIDVDVPGVDVPDTLPVPGLSELLEEDPPLTTSVEDVQREIPLLDEENFGQPQPLANLTLDPDRGYLATPGLYEMTLQSYCLKPGTYAPGGGDGYGYAPLEGPRSEIIEKILRQAVNYPEIEQRKIQVLLWGIIAQTRLSDMDEDVQAVARQILDEDEINEINGGALGLIPDRVRREIFANLPSPVRRVLAAKAELRDRLTRANAAYEELEQIAVLTGNVPQGEGSRAIPDGRWSLHPDGYFVRYFPSGYSRTRMQALVPRPATVERDQLGRITRIDYGDGYRLETAYNDSVGAISVPGEPEMEIYLFDVVRLVSPEKTVTVRDRGWTFVGTPTTGNARFSELSASVGFAKQNNRDRLGQIADDAQQRYEDAQTVKGKIEETQTTIERLDGQPTREEAQEVLDQSHYQDGVETVAENDPEAKGEWLGEHFQRVQQAFAYATCQLANLGNESSSCGEPQDENGNGDEDGGDDPGTPVDPGGQGAIPGNTNRQRLGLSGRPY
ncbi:MAG: hypothetical protein F6K03_12125, partial [Kamptonema sp. SIO4C4]|nr:hypothetical protein [Kamptonema sp. SIO4C4]